MRTTTEKLTKNDIAKTFKKLGIGKEKSGQHEISEWIEKSDFKKPDKENDVWIVADSTTSFINFNQQ